MAWLALLAAIGAASCTVERAQYVLRTAPQYTASFIAVDSGRDWPSAVALEIHSGVTGNTYWFLPWNGGSDGRQHLASTTDVEAPSWSPPSADGGPRPLGDFDYFGLDHTYRVLDGVPRRHGSAPAHILIPTLGAALWYRDLEQGGLRERPPTQFFDLVSCRPER